LLRIRPSEWLSRAWSDAQCCEAVIGTGTRSSANVRFDDSNAQHMVQTVNFFSWKSRIRCKLPQFMLISRQCWNSVASFAVVNKARKISDTLGCLCENTIVVPLPTIPPLSRTDADVSRSTVIPESNKLCECIHHHSAAIVEHLIIASGSILFIKLVHRKQDRFGPAQFAGFLMRAYLETTPCTLTNSGARMTFCYVREDLLTNGAPQINSLCNCVQYSSSAWNESYEYGLWNWKDLDL
jgi:hypothetical protein